MLKDIRISTVEKFGRRVLLCDTVPGKIGRNI